MNDKIYERWQLEVNDLCLFVGPTSIYTQLRHRLVYRVVGKEPDPHSSYSRNRYTLCPAFDLADRWDKSAPSDVSKLGTNHLVRLDLEGLCRLRLDFDNFIAERARELST